MKGRIHHASILVGILLAVTLVLPALVAPMLPIPDPDHANLSDRLLEPGSAGHLLGTDSLGRDVLSRLLHGLRLSLLVAATATLISAILGSAIGLIAGFYGRWVDAIFMRGMDMLLAFPYLIFALAMVAVMGPGLLNALIAIAVVNIPFFARNVRGATLVHAKSAFVEAAMLSGRGRCSILFVEVLPNVLPTIIIAMATTLGWMILETAGLSFLGLGAQPPTADLGSMLAEGRTLMLIHPHVGLLPGMVILLLVVGLNLVGDGLRDALDPRLSQGPRSAPGIGTVVASEIEQNQPHRALQGEAFVDVSGLTVSFAEEADASPAVDHVSFSIHKGEALGIVGQSGSGKSVTALALSRLVPSPPARITDGHIRIGTWQVLKASGGELRWHRGRTVGYIFQNPWQSLHPMIPVGRQVAESMQMHRQESRSVIQRRVRELLAQVAIDDIEKTLKAYPHQLSGGQCQRVGIALALANDPEILIADEPTTALDVTVQKQVLDLIRTIRRSRGLTLIFISHDLGVVRSVVDRVLVMRRGKIVEAGKVETVLKQPCHPYTRQLLADAPVLGLGARQSLGVTDSQSDTNAGEHAGASAFNDRASKKKEPNDTPF